MDAYHIEFNNSKDDAARACPQLDLNETKAIEGEPKGREEEEGTTEVEATSTKGASYQRA